MQDVNKRVKTVRRYGKSFKGIVIGELSLLPPQFSINLKLLQKKF